MRRQLALIKAVKHNHLDVEHFLGGHGSVGLYADLRAVLKDQSVRMTLSLWPTERIGTCVQRKLERLVRILLELEEAQRLAVQHLRSERRHGRVREGRGFSGQRRWKRENDTSLLWIANATA